MRNLPDHLKGLLITTIGVLALTPDSLLVRLIGIDVWTMVFWRGLLMMIGVSVGLVLYYREQTLARFLAVGRAGLVVAALFTVSSVLFILALHNTSVANTLVIVASAPLIAAIFSWLFRTEAVPPRTWAAILGALCGILVLVSDSPRGGTLGGDLAAFGTAVGLAAAYSLIRHARSLNMAPAMAVSGGLSAIVMIPFAAPLSVPAEDIWLLLILGLAVLPVSFGLISLGPRYLPAPEVALILLLETVLGPLWVWLALNEEPSIHALIGGAIVIGALILHSLAALMAQRRRPRAAAANLSGKALK